MSHEVRVRTAVCDDRCFHRTCTRLGYEHGKSRINMYGTIDANNPEVNHVSLPGWLKPVRFDASGTALFDNFSQNHGDVGTVENVAQGHWGDPQELKNFLREYAREAAHMSAEEQGYTVMSEEEVNGNLVVTLGGF